MMLTLPLAFEVLFCRWVTSDQYYWVMLGERRGTGACAQALRLLPDGMPQRIDIPSHAGNDEDKNPPKHVAKDVVDKIRRFRNLIHPARALKESYDPRTFTHEQLKEFKEMYESARIACSITSSGYLRGGFRVPEAESILAVPIQRHFNLQYAYLWVQ